MSFEASAWAVKAAVDRSAMKNLLMILAHITNDETEELYPSVAYLEAHTGLNRKTVMDCLQELESAEMGVLVRTGEMRGRTQQIPVYRFVRSPLVPLIIKRPGGKFEKPKSPKNGTVPKTDGKSPVFGGERVPKTGHGIEKGNREEEDSPLSLTGEAPPQDLFGDQLPVEASESLHEYVARGWDALRADHPRTNAIKVWNDSRINAVKARAAEFIKGTGSTLDHRGVWDLMFAAIRADQWLRGEAAASQRYPTPFSLSIDYLLRPRTFATILEKAATNEHDNRTIHDPVSGRRLGPAEQAGRRTLESVVNAAKSRETGGDTRSRYGARRSYIRES